MIRRTRYQQGSVQREKRHSGPDVWIFRWREIGPDGKSKQRKAIVGTVTTLSTEASALKAAHALRIDANQPRQLKRLIVPSRLGRSSSKKTSAGKDAHPQQL